MADEPIDRSVRDVEPRGEDEPAARARVELQRAYIQMSFGEFDDALDSCSRASEELGEHFLPETLRGAIMSAGGRHRDALATLERVRKRHPGEALPHLYFAETCFLSGRAQQASRALEDAEMCEMSRDEAAFLERLRELWTQVDPEDVPPPLEPVR